MLYLLLVRYNEIVKAIVVDNNPLSNADIGLWAAHQHYEEKFCNCQQHQHYEEKFCNCQQQQNNKQTDPPHTHTHTNKQTNYCVRLEIILV